MVKYFTVDLHYFRRNDDLSLLHTLNSLTQWATHRQIRLFLVHSAL